MKKSKNKMSVPRILVLSILVMSLLSSCKKGEEDPLISVLPRKTRLVGKWDLKMLSESSIKVTTKYTSSNSYYQNLQTTKREIEGERVTILTQNSSSRTGSTSSSSIIAGTLIDFYFHFNKDGTFIGKQSYKLTAAAYTYNNTTSNQLLDNYFEVSIEGLWSFVEGNKNAGIKSKESINISILTETTVKYDVNTFNSQYSNYNVTTKTFGINERTLVWNIVKLKNKELKLETTGNFSSSGFSIDKTPTSTNNSTKDVVKEDNYTVIELYQKGLRD